MLLTCDLQPLAFFLWFGIFCQVICIEDLSTTSVCTLDLACSLLRFSNLPSKRYLIGKPASTSWKASVSIAENIMLNNVGAITQPYLTPLVTGNGSEYCPSFWTRACMRSWNCRTIAMYLGGQPNFAIIFLYTLQSFSLWCYVPSFKIIGLMVLEKKIVLRFLPYMGMVAILDHWHVYKPPFPLPKGSAT